MRLIRALSAATLVMLSVSTAQAQVNITSFSITNHKMVTGPVTGYTGLGGAFDFTSAGYPFQEYLAFCIDPNRTFAFNTNYTNYKLYTLAQFVTLAQAPNQVNLNDMNYIAERVEAYVYANAGNTPANASNNAIQKTIWDVYTGKPGADGDGSHAQSPVGSWGVLANGANQTFLVRVADGFNVVPEPSTYAMMALGLAGLAAAARRRRMQA